MKRYTKYITLLITLTTWLPNCHAQNSALSQGEWYKIGVLQEGVYKLDAIFLQKTGINLSNVNPKNLKIYGNGGGMLPQANNISRPNDLTENAIYIEGEADGKFDAQDYLLFYAQSPHSLMVDKTKQIISHQTNIYSDTTFYFLQIGASAGLRVQNQPSISATQTITTFDDYVFYEKEIKNIILSGREWYGEQFSNATTQNFSFNLQGIVPNSTVLINSAVMAATSAESNFQVSLNDQLLGSQSIEFIRLGVYDVKGQNSLKTYSTKADGKTDLKINLVFNSPQNNTGVGYLNYMGVQTKRDLRLYDAQTTFRSFESLAFASANFQVKNVNAQNQIWDISNPLLPQNQAFTLANQQAIFGANTSTLKEFVVFNPVTIGSPVNIQKIQNQNLHGSTVPDLLIVVSEKLKAQAQRLADFRQKNDKLSVLIATLPQVYNEFSSGKADLTAIRDMAKFFYDKNPAKFKYLLLFGDASFDYKKRLLAENDVADTYIPVYESRESLNPIFSYSSDDYVGFLKKDDGEWTESKEGDHTLDIGVGRLPVRTQEQANQVIDKLIQYTNQQKTIGKWREKIAFVADDGDYNIHQRDADDLTKILSDKNPSIQIEKIYLDAFPKEGTGIGAKSPGVNIAINKNFKDGALIINYSGHGGEKGWAEEQILGYQDINSWTNFNNMPLLVTATCTFGRYDNPNETSGAELSFLNPQGGAIGLLTTTRPVYASTNFLLNSAFYNALFEPVNGQLPRLGDIMRLTKNKSLSGPINRNFALMGDPSMRLAYPQEQITISKINGKKPSVNDTLKALSKVTIEGAMATQTFNGTVFATIYDKAQTLNTRGNDGTIFSYQNYTSKLFEGKATASNGKFSLTFVVPKDIDYRTGKGKMFLYAISSDGFSDAEGVYEPLIGASEILNNSNLPPSIRVFMNNDAFKDGDETDPSPTLLVNVNDADGLNLSTNGLGHEMTTVLDDSVKIILNPYFSFKTDDYRSGDIRYPFKNLKEGLHNLKIKIWDVYNNSAEASLRFSVVVRSDNKLKNVFCFPNPSSTETVFSFEHDKAGDDLSITVKITDILGQPIQQFSQNVYQASSPLQEIRWNILNDLPQIANGMYFYSIFAESLNTNYQATGFGKLIILH